MTASKELYKFSNPYLLKILIAWRFEFIFRNWNLYNYCIPCFMLVHACIWWLASFSFSDERIALTTSLRHIHKQLWLTHCVNAYDLPTTLVTDPGLSKKRGATTKNGLNWERSIWLKTRVHSGGTGAYPHHFFYRKQNCEFWKMFNPY